MSPEWVWLCFTGIWKSPEEAWTNVEEPQKQLEESISFKLVPASLKKLWNVEES